MTDLCNCAQCRQMVRDYLAALAARDAAWSEPSCIAEYDRALAALRTVAEGADWLVSQPDANPLYDEPTLGFDSLAQWSQRQFNKATATGKAIDAIREHGLGGVPACPDCDCSLWPKPDGARLVWECIEPTCTGYTMCDPCRDCMHPEHEHHGDLHGVRYCQACVGDPSVPVTAICREYNGGAV